MGITLDSLFQLISNGGWVAVPGILVFILFTNMRGDWRPRREFDTLIEDRDEWKTMAQQAVKVSTEQSEQTSKLTGIVEVLTHSLSRGQ